MQVDAAGKLLIKGSTSEHNHAGNQMELVGEFLGSWRAWDGIRALDYLLSRPEIDPKHVGITGNSGFQLDQPQPVAGARGFDHDR